MVEELGAMNGQFSTKLFIAAKLERGDFRHLVLISYGAMDSICSFLSPQKLLSMQAVCKFMYCRGIERLQQSITLYDPVFFHYQQFSKWANSLFVYDLVTQKPAKSFILPPGFPFDLQDSQIIQLRHQILVFKSSNGRVDVILIDPKNLNGPSFSVKAPLHRSA